MTFEIPKHWTTRPILDTEATEALIRRLKKPTGPVDVVIDTDTYNEIDDQFALAYLIKKDEKLKLKAIYAAPFFNTKSTGPDDGMEKSYEEILRVLSLMKRDDLKSIVYRGSESFLPPRADAVESDAAKFDAVESNTLKSGAVESDAARHLIKLAAGYSSKKPLYVVAIGAITNVASALLMEPTLKDKIVLVWLGGNAHGWHHNAEFNLYQDVAAARIVFGCGVPLVQLPCAGVVSALTTSGPELEYWLRGKNELCDYLVDNTIKNAIEDGGLSTWTRVIWDVAAVAWLLDGGDGSGGDGGDGSGGDGGGSNDGKFMLDRLEPSPIPEYDHHYAFDRTRHPIRYVFHIHRDAIFEDLFRTLAL